MGHHTRPVSKAIAAKHLSPMRNTNAGKCGVSTSPADSFLHKGRLNGSSNASGSSASNRNAYHYNQMVANNREQFNAMHFG